MTTEHQWRPLQYPKYYQHPRTTIVTSALSHSRDQLQPYCKRWVTNGDYCSIQPYCKRREAGRGPGNEARGQLQPTRKLSPCVYQTLPWIYNDSSSCAHHTLPWVYTWTLPHMTFSYSIVLFCTCTTLLPPLFHKYSFPPPPLDQFLNEGLNREMK